MTRWSALSLAASLVVQGACGTKHATPEGSETISQSGAAGYGELVEQGATSMALHRAGADTEAEIVLTTARGRTFMHPEGSPLALATAFEAHLVDVREGVVWMASRDALAKVAAGSLVAEPALALPMGAHSSAIEIGFDGSVFVADARANRIYRAKGDAIETLAEGASLSHPRALQLMGGNLIVGSDAGVYTLALASGEQTELASMASGVAALALDHLGYVIVADESGAISQLRSDGSIKLLHKGPGGIESIAFDERARVLYVATEEKTSRLAYLELTGEAKEVWAARDARPMRRLAKNGMILSGAEYWPSQGTTNVVYPDDILWGFYPAPDQVFEGSAAPKAPSAAATRCAEQSYEALMKFFDESPEAFHRAVATAHTSNRFYLWVNDYSQTDEDFPHELRMNKFWYWQRDPVVKGRVPGFWKWETTLLRDGRCLWPESAQIEAYLAEKNAEAQ